MSEELSDFFKLISEDKKKKKKDFNEMVGDLGLDSLFNDIAAEKKRIREEKEKQLAKKVEEEKKQKDKFDKIVGEIDVESLFEDLSKIKKESKEEQLAEENRQKKVLTSFENFLTTKIDDIEETKEEIIEEVKAEVVEEVEVESEPEVPTFVEKSLDILNEVSDPLTPPDQNFATLQDLQDHYRKFLVRIQQQLSSLGGGGIEDAPKTGGPYVRQGQKWVVSSGGGGIGTDGSVNTTGIITASSFSGNNLNVTGITTLASAGGITTTGGDLYVGGDLFVLDDIVYDEVDGRNLNISGVATVGTILDVNGNLDVSGISTFQGDVRITDDDKLRFGTSGGGTLQVYTNGTNSFFKQISGDLKYELADQFIVQKDSGDEPIAKFNADADVELYYDGSKKLETTATGIDVTGHTETDTLNVSGISTFQGNINLGDNDNINLGDGGDLKIFHDGNANYIVGNNGSLNLKSDSYAYLKGLSSNGKVQIYHDNSKKFETTSIGISVFNGSGDTATIAGPGTLIIDPAIVGDNTGILRIKGDLFVDGTTTQINSTTIEFADFVVGVATTATTNLLTDGAGIGIGSDKTFLYEFNSGSNPSLKSSENLNVASGKVYQIAETERLSADTLSVGTGATVHSPASNTLTLGTAGTERLRITSDGSVGIGTTSAEYKVTVYDAGYTGFTIKSNRTTATDNIGGLHFKTQSTDVAYIQSLVNGTIKVRNTSSLTERLRITSDGKIGIGGETSPEYKVTVYDAGYSGVTIKSNRTTATDNIGGLHFKTQNTNVAYIQSLVDGTIKVRNSSSLTERLRITSDGKVGIGTNNPLGTLHVSSGTSGDATLILEADTDNNNEADNPNIIFRQDGGLDLGAIGMNLTNSSSVGPSNQLYVAASSADAAIVFATGTSNGYTNATERLRISSGGNIGIGTNNPAYKIDFGSASNVNNQIRLVQGNGGTALRIGAGGGSNDFTMIRVDGGIGVAGGASNDSAYGFSLKYMGSRSGNANSLSLFSDDQQATPIEAITVFQDGKVGIGNTNPEYKLHVEGDIKVSSTGAIWFDNTPGTIEKISATNSTIDLYADSRVRFFESDASSEMVAIHVNDGKIYFNGDEDTYWHRPAANTHAFVNSGSETMRITGIGGSVGIGLNDPDCKLHVKGDVQVGDSSIAGHFLNIVGAGANQDFGIRFGSGAGNPESKFSILGSTSNGDMRFRFGETERVRITSTGGINVLSQNVKFETSGKGIVLGSSGNSSIKSDAASDNNIVINAGGSETMRITGIGGSVGIGINDPDCRLHVKGDVQVGDSSTAGHFLNIVGAGAHQLFGVRFGSGAGNPDAKAAILSTTSTSGDLIFRTAGDATDRIRIDSNGDVGIGIADPQERLHVARIVMVTGNTPQIRLNANDSDADDDDRSMLGQATAAGNFVTTAADNDTILRGTATGNLLFGVGTAEKFRITSDGKFGFGTNANIDERGQIETSTGNCRLKLETGDTSVAGFVLKTSARRFDVQAQNDFFHIYDSTGSGERVRIDSSGRILIGRNSSPSGGDAHSLNARLVVHGRVGNTADSGRLNLQRGSAASFNGSSIGSITFTDSSNNAFARIESLCDGTPGTDDYPGRIVFSTTPDGSTAPTENFRISSDGTSTFSGHVHLGDDDELRFGAGNDFKIVHDPNDCRFENSNGDIKFKNTGSYFFFDEDGGETLASFINDGAVNLYHNNSKKFETVGTGVTVYGDAYIGSDNSRGVILTSPNGTKYRLIVANDGTLSTTSV